MTLMKLVYEKMLAKAHKTMDGPELLKTFTFKMTIDEMKSTKVVDRRIKIG